MNETIGEKGGARDRRRTMIISQHEKKKLEDYEEAREIAELEKKVRKQQIYTLIKTLPIVIGGGTIQTLYDTATGKRRIDKEEENSKWRIKEYDGDITHMTPEEFREKQQRRRRVVVTPTGEKVIVYVSPDVETLEDLEEKIEELEQPEKKEVSILQPIKEILSPSPKVETLNPVEKQEEKPLSPEEVDVETFIDREFSPIDFSNLSPAAKEKLDKLQSRKIVEEYEKQLKDIRFELRHVIYEYNVLVDQGEEIVVSKDAEIILDRLSDIIDKVEELKRKIKIEDLDKYDDNYIYYLIEGYLQEFRDKRIISEIKDSPLYVMISEKLDELEQKRGTFSKTVEEKKERLEDKEKDFEQLKKRYYSIDQLNNQLLEFQYDQNRTLKEIQEKVRNATTETEKVREEFVGMNRQSRRLMRMLAFQMFLPGPRFARGAAASAAAYLYFMNNVIRPQTRTVRYKVITVTDYHDQIKDSIMSLEDAIRLLGKTSDQIDKMMIELEDRYKEYLGKVPEFDELLSNLKKVKRDMEEKEYEMQRIKKEQELALEKNDQKVKKIGEYPVN